MASHSKAIPFALSIAALAIGFAIHTVFTLLKCDSLLDINSCRAISNVVNTLSSSLIYLSIITVIPSTVAAISAATVFTTWRSFSKIWIPIMFLVFLITPGRALSSMIFSYPYRLYVAILLGTLYILISFILIGWKSYSLRKKS